MVLRHTAALATDVISGPSQGFQSTTAEEIQMSSQNEIQARLHCVCPLHACTTHFPRAAQTVLLSWLRGCRFSPPTAASQGRAIP